MPKPLSQMIFICAVATDRACAIGRLRSTRRSRSAGRSLPAHAEVHLLDAATDAATQLDAAARLSANFDRFNLGDRLRYSKQYLRVGAAAARRARRLGFIGSGHVGDVRLRGSTSFDVSPVGAVPTAELSAYWSATENVDWEGDLAYDALQPPRSRAGSRTFADSTAWRSR